MSTYDALILGAGAAGLMCAMRAGQRGRKVLLLDHAKQVGSKILISGGGRCNFTNLACGPDRYYSENPAFCRSALSGFTPQDFLALLEKHKIPYHEKALGQLFCDHSAKDLVAMLEAECRTAGVEIRLNQEIIDVRKDEGFIVQTRQDVFQARTLVLATGGLSIPKMGASGLSHQLAKRFGLAVTATRPALVPFVFEGPTLAMMRELSGLSLGVRITCGKITFRDDMLFTHRGLSGPAILQISSVWREGEAITINLLPDLDAEAFLIARKNERPKATLKTILGEVLPQRLAQNLAKSWPSAPIGELPNKKLKDIAATLNKWVVVPSSTEGYAKAEVTRGGISTRELSSKTMEAKKVPGLYIIGEALDVTGWLGGYNFQWAWSSGWAAGSSL